MKFNLKFSSKFMVSRHWNKKTEKKIFCLAVNLFINYLTGNGTLRGKESTGKFQLIQREN